MKRYTQRELKNLDFKQDLANDNMIRVIRRDDKIQKDFFSAGEYGIYAVVQMFELPYYKKKRTLTSKKITLKSYNTTSTSNRASRRNRSSLDSRRNRR